MASAPHISRKTWLTGLLYGACLGLLTALMVWAKYRFLVFDHAAELYALIVGIIFIMVGAWIGNRLTRPRTIIRQEVVIREVPAPEPAASRLFIKEKAEDVQTATGISQRELDVLQLLAKGLSNEEIAGQLFVSQNTVKTHLSNLYFKLDVKRRTQAVEKGRAMGLIA